MQKLWQKILLLCVACVIYMQGLCLAEVAPNEVLTGVNTANTTINELVNEKPLFIIMGPTWAEPFVKAMSTIETMYKKYGNQLNFAAILVDDQTSAAAAATFVQSRRLTVPVYMCDSKKIKKDYNLQAYPMSFFVAPDGTILGKDFGNMAEQRWDNFLSRNLETLGENTGDAMTVLDGSDDVDPSMIDNVPLQSEGAMQYRIMESGAIEFVLRVPWYEGQYLYLREPPYYIVSSSDSVVVDGLGDYTILGKTKAGEEGRIEDKYFDYGSFTYDSKTDMFTFYRNDYDGMGNVIGACYDYRMRVIDKNTVYIEKLEEEPVRSRPIPRIKQDTSYPTITYRYVPFSTVKDRIPGAVFEAEYTGGWVWFGDRDYWPHEPQYSLLTFYVDGLLAFKAAGCHAGNLPKE